MGYSRFVLILLLTLGFATSTRAQESSPVAAPANGVVEKTLDLDGRAIHVACAGEGSPTVILEPGGPSSDGGTAVLAIVGNHVSAALGTRFCAYDRAGTGLSDPDPVGVRTFDEGAADLNAVLAMPELECPCILLGESLGGGITQVALAADPTNFAGLVLLDSVYPGSWDAIMDLAAPDSPEAALATDSYWLGENEESLDMVASFQQPELPVEPPGIPVIVVSHGVGDPPPCNFEPPCSESFPTDEYEARWQAGQVELASALGGRLVIAEGTSHYITENEPLVFSVVGEVISAVLDPGSWATPEASPST